MQVAQATIKRSRTEGQGGGEPALARGLRRSGRRSPRPANRLRVGLRSLLLLIALACAACGGGAPSASRNVNPADVRMQVSVDPTPPVNGQPGTVNITLRTDSGAAVSGAKLIVIQGLSSFGTSIKGVSSFDSRLGGMQPVSTNAPEHGAGHYVAGNVQFPSQESWVLTVSGQLPGGGSIQGTFDTTGTPAAGQAADVWQPITNPVPVTDASVGAGKAIFESNCTICHGQTGQGNGPAAAGLIPPPANLAVHVPMHPEGMLWYWISNGIARTAMPAWKGSLSNTQRWELIDYLRNTFVQPTATPTSATPTPAPAGNGGVRMQLSVSPQKPSLGPARLQITLTQADGSPVDNATVNVSGTMTGMYMAPDTAKLRGQGSGRYVANSYPFTMTGSWQIHVTAKLPNGPQTTQTFDVQVK
jgi:mono/diheme cytochrome c family protein